MPQRVIKSLTKTKHQCILDVGSMWAMYNSKDMLGIMSQSNCESQGSHTHTHTQDTILCGRAADPSRGFKFIHLSFLSLFKGFGCFKVSRHCFM